MRLVPVDNPLDFWEVNMADPEALEELRIQTGEHDDPQRLLFRAWLRRSACENMLDCGAGPGWELDGIVADGIEIRYEALEATPSFVEALNRRGVSARRGSVTDLRAYGDGSVDLVYCRHVLEHVGDFDRAVAEMLRVSCRYVYVAMNKDFVSDGRGSRRTHYGLPHNVYTMSEFRATLRDGDTLKALGQKSYLVTL